MTQANKAANDLVERINRRRKECGGDYEPLINLGIFTHGGNKATQSPEDCEFVLDGDTVMNAVEFVDKIFLPLSKSGARMNSIFSQCYGGCLAEWVPKILNTRKFLSPSPACFISSTSKDRVSYGSDPLFDATHDALYPHFLKKMKNPAKANLCSMGIDSWNAVQMSSSNGVKSQQTDSKLDLLDFTDPTLLKTLDSIGKKMGFGDGFSQDCKAAAKDRPRAPFALNKQQQNGILKCGVNIPEFGVDTAMIAAAQVKSPGVLELEKLDRLSNEELSKVMGGCDFKMSDYKVPYGPDFKKSDKGSRTDKIGGTR